MKGGDTVPREESRAYGVDFWWPGVEGSEGVPEELEVLEGV